MVLCCGRTKQQGVRLQRQVLHYLTKEKAHPAMISTVAANLIDMLWEQNKLGEAEATLYQAREVDPPPPPPPHPLVLLHHHTSCAATLCLHRQ